MQYRPSGQPCAPPQSRGQHPDRIPDGGVSSLASPHDRSTLGSCLAARLSGKPCAVQGDVALFCVAALSIPALFVAPVGARWATRAPAALLRRLLAFCLAAIAPGLLLGAGV